MRVKLGERAPDDQASLREILVDLRGGRVRDLPDQRAASPAATQLVEGRVARDPEQPRAFAAAARLEQATPPERTLEGEGRHVFRRGAIA